MADKRSARRLWDNLQALLKEHKRKINYVVTEAGLGGSGADALREMKPIGLDRLDRIAAVFNLEAWQLLIPDLDPKNPPVRWVGQQDEKKFEKLERAQKVLEGQ